MDEKMHTKQARTSPYSQRRSSDCKIVLKHTIDNLLSRGVGSPVTEPTSRDADDAHMIDVER